MKQDNWEDTKTGATYGVNSSLGSPRSWLQRAVGWRASDLGLHPTSLDPRNITVAGIWLRGEPMIDSGSWPALYRFFEIYPNIRKPSLDKNKAMIPITGMAVAVPADHIFEFYNQVKQSARWVWFNWPLPENKTVWARGQMLDHAELYKLFEQGLKARQVAKQYNLLIPSVEYVYKKWQRGADPSRAERKCIDHGAVAQDIRLGVPVTKISQSYNISRTMIYNIKKEFEI
jgi:hypothetical protein